MTTSVERAARTARRQIGGVVGDRDGECLRRLRAQLGRGAAVLDPRAGMVVAEWDCCYLDGASLDSWEDVVAANRVADVSGAFAIAWVDAGGALHLARDAVGERSLFYAVRGGFFAFASTIRALVAARAVAPAVDERAIPAYLSYGYVPGRDTLVEGVQEVLPGELVTFAGGRVSMRPLCRLPAQDDRPQPDAVYVEELRETVEAAVQRRLPYDGEPFAATLSGGIDSSVVAAVASAARPGAISAYSLSFGRGLPNEVPFATLVARHCGLRHHVVDLTPRVVMDRFDATLSSLSTPIGEPLTVANALLFERIAPENAVVLNGEGGDPCFGGPKNLPMLLREVFGPRPGETRERFRERAYLAAHRKCFDDLVPLLGAEAGAQAALRLERALTPFLGDARWPSLVNRLAAINITFKGGHHILPKVDHLSRAAATLGRSPLFDRDVVHAAARMPASLKLRDATEKHALKLAFADALPVATITRPKSGMRVPLETWLEGKFERFARDRIMDGLGSRDLFRREYLEGLVGKRPAAVPRRGVKVWMLLSLEAWLREVVR